MVLIFLSSLQDWFLWPLGVLGPHPVFWLYTLHKAQVIGSLPVNRPIFDNDVPDEPLLGLLPPIEVDDTYNPSTWGAGASLSKIGLLTGRDPITG